MPAKLRTIIDQETGTAKTIDISKLFRTASLIIGEDLARSLFDKHGAWDDGEIAVILVDDLIEQDHQLWLDHKQTENSVRPGGM